jgi:catechol 2,3-dioxygenase-like lactoylglutathione lyase family enzyme
MESLGITRLDHVAMAVWNVEEYLPFLTELFGMKVVDRWRSEEEKYAGVTLDLPGGGIQWEVVEPISDDSFLARFPGQRRLSERLSPASCNRREHGHLIAWHDRGVQPVKVTDIPAVEEYIYGWRDGAVRPRQALGDDRPKLAHAGQHIANGGTVREGHIDLPLAG